jgi:hypothetical protein
MLARVSISAIGSEAPAANAGPGSEPVEVVTTLFTAAKAFARPGAFDGLAPTLAYEDINGASDQTAAIVVTSLTLINVDEARLPQGPSAAINAKAELLVPALRPGFPPVAVMYTGVEAVGHA